MYGIYIFLSLIAVINSNLFNLTDSNFDLLVKNGEISPWVVMFYIKMCPRCATGHELLEKYANYNSTLQFGRVECNENSFTCLRFEQLNVTRMPNLIVVEKSRVFEYKGVFQNESTLQMIMEEERTVEKGRKLPPSIGYYGLISRVILEVLNIGDFLLEEFVVDNLGIQMKWSRTHTLVVFLSVILFIIVVEYMIFAKCCKKQKNSCGEKCSKKHVHKHNINNTANKRKVN
jgi:hypothetical protein